MNRRQAETSRTTATAATARRQFNTQDILDPIR